MFSGLIQNEFIKIFSKLKTYVILLLFIALSAMIAYIAQDTENYYLDSVDPAYRVMNLEDEVRYYKQNLQDVGQYTDWTEEEKTQEIENLQEGLTDAEKELSAAKEDLKINATYDWRKAANLELENYKADLKDVNDPESKANIESEIERLTYHLDHDISTAEPNLNTGLNYLNLSLVVILSGFMTFGLILFNADIMSGEYSPGTLKFLLIQPVTRIKVLLAKYLSTVLASLGLIVGVQLLFTAAVGLVKGFGSANLPMMAGERYKVVYEEGLRMLWAIPGSGEFISLSSYLLRALLLEVLFIFAMVAFIMMVSVISKSTVMAFTILISALLGTNIIYGLSSVYRKVSPYIFLHHTDVNGIITGNIIQQTGVLNFTYTLSLIVLSLSTVVFLSIAMVIFKKRDILI